MPGRVTIKIGDVKFNADDAVFAMNTQKDHAGMPVLQTLNTSVHIHVNLNDDKNVPFASLKQLFELGNVPTRDKIKDITIEFWKDDSMGDVICSYKFKGWVSLFRVSNVGGTSNHALDMELTPIINKENYQEIAMSN